jgi:hypothetical protein
VRDAGQQLLPSKSLGPRPQVGFQL